jgi:hypothetical protein
MASTFEIELEMALRADPFIPFDLVLEGGVRYRVSSPYMLHIRDAVMDHYPYGSDQHNLLRTNQLAAIEWHGPVDGDQA